MGVKSSDDVGGDKDKDAKEKEKKGAGGGESGGDAPALTKAQEEAIQQMVGGSIAGHFKSGKIAAFGGDLPPINLGVLAVQAKVVEKVWQHYPRSAARYAGEIGNRVTAELAIARARGETFFETGKRLQRRLPEVFNYARNRAELIAVTEGMNAYNAHHEAGILELTRQDPGWLMRWDATPDGRLCPACFSLDGSVIDPRPGQPRFIAVWTVQRVGGPTRHAKFSERPPLHARCRCVIGPWREEWAS